MAISRRYFFYGSLLAGAVPAVGFGSTPSLKAAGYKSPNEKAELRRDRRPAGKAPANIAAAAPTENIVALCDVDDRRAAETFTRFTNAPKYRDFRQMLDKEGKNIDAVIVATPDHMHATAAMWCMERGKHVYVQKPLVRTVWEARQLREAAAQVQGRHPDGQPGLFQRRHAAVRGDHLERRYRQRHRSARLERPSACGRRASPRFPRKTRFPPRSIGTCGSASPRSGPSPRAARPNPTANGGFFYQPFNWRGFYDFGCGALGDMACHILGAPNMALHLSNRKVVSVECIKKEGVSPFMFPKASVIRFDFAAYGNMPAAEGVLVRRPEGDSEDCRRSGRRVARRSADPGADGGAAAAGWSARRRPAVSRARRTRTADPAGNEFRSPGRVFNQEEFEALKASTTPLRFPQPDGSLFIGDKGMLTPALTAKSRG